MMTIAEMTALLIGIPSKHYLHSEPNMGSALNGGHLSNLRCSCGRQFVANEYVHSMKLIPPETPSLAGVHTHRETALTMLPGQHETISAGDIIEPGTVVAHTANSTETLYQLLTNGQWLSEDGRRLELKRPDTEVALAWTPAPPARKRK